MLPWCPRFAACSGALDQVLLDAKQHACPHCGRVGTLIGHGLLWGYAEQGSERVVRGRRLLCTARGRRAGCGRAWSVRLSSVMAAFCARARPLSGLLTAIVGGARLRAAWTSLAPGLSLRSGYRLWQRLRCAQSHLRTTLCSMCPPPISDATEPLAQLLSHLQYASGAEPCVLSSFQLTFQRSVFS